MYARVGMYVPCSSRSLCTHVYAYASPLPIPRPPDAEPEQVLDPHINTKSKRQRHDSHRSAETGLSGSVMCQGLALWAWVWTKTPPAELDEKLHEKLEEYTFWHFGLPIPSGRRIRLSVTVCVCLCAD
jgi:hypothetical protein